MDEDLIKVLHFRNPHLIWVEVQKHDTISLRQIGLFGVVPRVASMVDGQRVCSKSDLWDPRVNEILEEFLETKHPLTFKSTYRLDEDDEPSSILYNQPHIFGELSMRKPDGTKKLLSTSLDNSVYAFKNKNEFWQMLTSQKIETVLKENEQIDVLRQIIKYYKDRGTWNRKKDIFYQHLSTQQLTYLKEKNAELTVENLEKHLLLMSGQDEQSLDTSFVIEKPNYKPPKKYIDFNSNTTKPELAPVEFVENVLKNLIVKSNDEPKSSLDNKQKTRRSLGDIKRILKRKEIIVNEYENNIKNTVDIPKSELSYKVYDEELNDEPKVDEQGVKVRGRASSRIKKSEPSPESPASNLKTEERLVAYGPPIGRLEQLVRKKVRTATESQEAPDSTLKETTIIWDDDKSSTGYDTKHKNDNLSKSVNSNDSRRSYVNLDSSDDNVNVNNSSKKADVKLNLNDPQVYNDFIQSKQEKNIKELQTLHSNVSYTEKDKKPSVVDKERKVKNASSTRLLEMLRRRQEVAKIYNSSSSSTDCSKNVRIGKRETRELSVSDTDSLVNGSTDKSNYPETSNSDEELEEIRAKLDTKLKPLVIENKTQEIVTDQAKTHVNPYKNLEPGRSVFVENLIQPLILAHCKHNEVILPQSSLRDIPFKMEIFNTLRNMQVQKPNRLQSVSWPYILRGHSMVMVGAAHGGKTLGYIPPVCNLVLDYNYELAGLGPICIIVCATAKSVTEVAKQCRIFLNYQRVITCYSGVDSTKFAIDLRNGCDVLVTTPSMLYKWLGMEIGIDLRRLTTLVFEDCERLSLIYELELKAIQIHVKQMLKSRHEKAVKVQYILASRQWCDFMTPLAKKAHDTIVTFSAFHECVLYAKTNTSVSVVRKEKKIDAVVDFILENHDLDRLTVIVCRSDDEVELLRKTLTNLKYNVVACNNEMDIHELYKLRNALLTSILICCDGNLSHLNVTNAHYLIHYSMPAVFSRFCRRFSVLNDNYPSIFTPTNANIKIKILLEESNVEQLPRILNFVKRCSSQVPDVLDKVANQVLEQKDIAKAEKLVPICDSLLSLGECADSLACQERHAILEAFDEPNAWMPLFGTITFKIIHYSSAIAYSARLLTHSTGDNRKKYPETYGTLCVKLGMYFSKEQNKRLHGEPKLGDICAVSVRQNFIARCQVLKIIDYEKGKAMNVVINLIDEEFITVVRAVELYYLPEEFKTVETHVVKVRLVGIRPQDRDVTFSELAMNTLKRITDEDEQLYLRGRIVMTVGNAVFIDFLEACADLSALSETVVKYDFKKMLLETHAIPNPDHLIQLTKLCDKGNLKVQQKHEVNKTKSCETKQITPVKKEAECRWAHLDKNDWSDVVFTNMINPGKFFIRLQKFNKCIESLTSDIKIYVKENPEPVDKVHVNDIVLAEYPDYSVYERAIIDKIIDDTKVTCFFVDNADWRDVSITKVKKIPSKFIKQLPFQSIECRLVGISPPGDDWIDFSTNWFEDNCLEDDKGDAKRMFVKYFVKEKAEITGGHKYGVLLVDTSGDNDVIINKRMLQLNLASIKKDEEDFLNETHDFVREKTDTSSCDDDFEDLHDKNEPSESKVFSIPNILKTKDDCEWSDIDDSETSNKLTPYEPHASESPPLPNPNPGKLIRSIPLVSESDEDLDKWDICMDDNLGKAFGLPKLTNKDTNQNNDDEANVTFIDKENIPKITALSPTAYSKNNELIIKSDHFGQNVESSLKSHDSKIDRKNLIYEQHDWSYESDTSSSVLRVKKLNKSNITNSTLDSDDTQSIISETDKVVKKANILDSDDSESITSKSLSIKELEILSDKNENIRHNKLKSIAITEINKCINANNETNRKSLLEDAIPKSQNAEKDIEDNIEMQKNFTKGKAVLVTETSDPIRTPTLIWKQNKDQITIKVKLVVDNYELEINNRSVKFSASQNETKYAFDIELYGVIQNEKTQHSNKGQYILIHLFLMIKKVKWLKLTTGPAKNWIVYDVDSIDTSSDEETPCNEDTLKMILEKHERELEGDDDDDDDTTGYRYRED